MPPADDTDSLASYRALARRLLRPDRPRLVECLMALSGAPEEACREAIDARDRDALRALSAVYFAQDGRPWTGPAEPRDAWEVIAPVEWVGDARRAFAAGAGEPAREWPATVRLALALASDPRGVETAEALAREAAHKLRALGGGAATRVVWRRAEARTFRSGFAADARAVPTSFAATACARALEASRPAPGLEAEAEQAARTVHRLGAAHAFGCAADAGFFARWEVLARRLGADNPFAPLTALWATGYALDAVTDDAVVLAATEL